MGGASLRPFASPRPVYKGSRGSLSIAPPLSSQREAGPDRLPPARVHFVLLREGSSPAWAETALPAERDLRGFGEPRCSGAEAGE